MKLKKMKLNYYPKTVLGKEEVDVIIAVVLDTIAKNRDSNPQSGTFMLYWIKEDEQVPQEIITFDFEKGPSQFFNLTVDDSHEVARNVLHHDASVSHESSGSHISYYHGSPLYLDLKTNFGRFTCAYYAEHGYYTDMTRVYCAVAQTLAELHEEDGALKNGFKKIIEVEMDKNSDLYDQYQHIRTLFYARQLPEIKAWKKWFANSAESSRLLFM